jgi:hypothetical protein
MLVRNLPGQQHLDATLKESFRSRMVWAQSLRLKPGAATVKSGGKHAAVIENNKVVGAEQIHQIGKVTVLQASVRGVEVQHPRGGAIGKRLLGYEFGGQVVMKLRYEHVVRLQDGKDRRQC